MFTSYFDASGGEEHAFIVVSGWVSTIERWERFEVDWKLALASFDVPYFHMREFAHSVDAYASWKGKEPQRKRFLKTLIAIIRDNAAYGVACVCRYDNFARVNEEYRLSEWIGNPYSLCGRDCVANVNRYIGDTFAEQGVEYIFDDGDQGKNHLLSAMERSNLPLPIFKPSRDRGDLKGLVQLQAADLAAYELFRGTKLGEAAPLHRYRKPLRALAAIRGWWGHYSEANLVDMCLNAGVPRRQTA